MDLDIRKKFQFGLWMLCLISILVVSSTSITECQEVSPPHIIFIVADDLGWNDVGFHGSIQIPTPNIDSLAYSGVILNNYYVQPICTPSRSALLSGMHPIHTGLQHHSIGGAHPYGLPLNYNLLPKFLDILNYKTKAVGKWHLGHFMKDYTPTHRGFLSHYGYWTGRHDYYSRTSFERPGWWGYDFRRDMKVDRTAYGNYTTDLLTSEAVSIICKHDSSEPLFLYLAHLAVHSGNPYDPLQAPADVVRKFSYIQDVNRRKFAAMLWKLDESVGEVVKALMDNNMLENTIIVFTTDNGGPAAGFNQNAASNWPLRGVKAGMWEGGVRGASFVWSPLIKNPGRVSDKMMQIMDWFPSLYAAAGGNVDDLPHMDGINMWPSIAEDVDSPRRVILHNIDPIVGGAALRFEDWKLIFKPSGYGPDWDKWFGPSGRQLAESYVPHSKHKKLLTRAVKKSDAGKAILSLMPHAFKNIHKLRRSAEVLCGEVPSNATESCNDENNPCLFHIPSDPCEYHDVSKEHPDIVKVLQGYIRTFNSSAIPPANKNWDPLANPVYWEYTWANWQDFAVHPRHLMRKFPDNLLSESDYADNHLWM